MAVPCRLAISVLVLFAAQVFAQSRTPVGSDFQNQRLKSFTLPDRPIIFAPVRRLIQPAPWAQLCCLNRIVD